MFPEQTVERKSKLTITLWGLAFGFLIFSAQTGHSRGTDSDQEIAVGKRLFLDPRFSQVFESVPSPRLATPPSLDPQYVFKAYGPQRLWTSCASCHAVKEFESFQGGGPRAYTDFERRSTVPRRDDGVLTTVRNSPTLLEVLSNETTRGESLTHFDGEFSSIEALVLKGLTGRNFGWLQNETQRAQTHLVRIIREDAGNPTSAAAIERRPYRELPEFKGILNRESEVAQRVAELVGAYVRSLRFSRDRDGNYDGSPYDQFLRANRLPLSPAPDESALEYAVRLRNGINELRNPVFINAEGTRPSLNAPGLRRHLSEPGFSQRFSFGTTELQGLKVFLAEDRDPQYPETAKLGVGMCFRCHTPPSFTDLRFHSVGTAQVDFAVSHGDGFRPWVQTLLQNPGTEPRVAARVGRDLGVWHVLDPENRNPSQRLLRKTLCDTLKDESEFGFQRPATCTMDQLVRASIGRFKTPTLRNLGHSGPYFHDGSKSTIRDAVFSYMQHFPNRERFRDIEGISPILHYVELNFENVELVTAFLRSLNEDYE